MPTKIGRGASSISIKGCGRIGTKAKHHLNGYNREFRPRIADDKRLYLPMNTKDFSTNTAEINLSKLSSEKRENRVGQNQ